MRYWIALVLLLSAAFVADASAGVTIQGLGFLGGVPASNGTFTGLVGEQFTVGSTPLAVSELGAYDPGAKLTGIYSYTGSVEVGIVNRTTDTIVAETTFTSSSHGTFSDGYLFIAPTLGAGAILSPGGTYEIQEYAAPLTHGGAQGHEWIYPGGTPAPPGAMPVGYVNFPNQNTYSIAGGHIGTLPNVANFASYSGTHDQIAGGSFLATSTSTPEPGSLVVWGVVGVLGLYFWGRRNV